MSSEDLGVGSGEKSRSVKNKKKEKALARYKYLNRLWRGDTEIYIYKET